MKLHAPLLKTAVALVLILVLVAVAAFVLLATPTGTAWLAQRADGLLPALTLEGVDGALTTGVNLKSFRWEQDALSVTGEDVHIALDWSAVLVSEIRLSTLAVGQLAIDTGPPKPEQDNPDPIELPALSTPVILGINQLDVSAFVVNDATILGRISGALTWEASQLRFAQLSVAVDKTTIDADGRMTLEGRWPLSARVGVTDPRAPGPVSAKLSGSLHDLALDGRLQGDYPVNVNATLEPLSPDLPLSLQAGLRRPVAQTLGGQSLELQRARLRVAGNLQHLEGELEAQVDQLAGKPLRLDAAAHWDGSELALRQVDLVGGDNRVDLNCQSTALQDPVFDCQMDLALAAVEQLWPSLQDFALHGPVSFRLQPLSGQRFLAINATVEKGHYQGEPIDGEIQLEAPRLSRWQIQTLQWRMEGYRLDVSGEVGLQSDTELNARVATPAWGAVDITLASSVTGKGGRRVDAQLTHTDGHRLALACVLDAGQSTSTQLNCAEFNGAVYLDALKNAAQIAALPNAARHDGQSPEEQEATVNGKGADVANAPPKATGDQGADPARGTASVVIAWQLRDPLRIEWQADKGALSIDPWCLEAAPASLCQNDSVHYRDGQLRDVALKAEAVPLRWMQPWLAENVELLNDSRAELSMQLAGLQPLQLEASLAIPGTQWRWQAGGRSFEFGLKTIAADADLNDQRAVAKFELQPNSGGAATVDVTVDAPRTERRLEGNIAVRELPLEPLMVLSPAFTALGGELSADIAIGGQLQQPTLDGEAELSDGRLALTGMEHPIEALALTANFDGEHLRWDGGFNYGNGQATTRGALRWALPEQPWKLTASLRGQSLLFTSLPRLEHSEIAISPDLDVEVIPKRVAVDGELAVDRANIVLQELPPETISPSPDARVIGGDVKAEAPWVIHSNVRVRLGEAFRIEGYGAKLQLSGDLAIDRDARGTLQADGEVSVDDGQYSAYGQDLEIQSGSILFVGPVDNPDLNIKAIRRLPATTDVVAGLHVQGPLQSPTATLFSEPPMSESAIAHYILTGHPPRSAGAGGEPNYRATVLAMGLSRGAGQAKELAEMFGIKDFTIDTVSGEGGSEAAFSGRLTDDLTIAYRTSLTDEAAAVILRYQLTEHLVVEAIQGVHDSLDFIYSFSIE